MPETVSVPILRDLAPDGFFYGGHYIVEFDPDSLWYETSLTIASLALKEGTKTEYHVFQHFPSEAIEAFSRLGLDARKLEREGLLSIWDSYTETVEYEAEKKKKHGPESNLWESTKGKPLDVLKSAPNWTKKAKAGYSEKDKRWLHIDDNTAIFLQYNDEKTMIDAWRTAALPYGIRAREAPHLLAFANGAASDVFYTKFEALCDGIIDLKAQEEGGRIENYIRIRMLRGKSFDSSWRRLQLTNNGEVRLVHTSSRGEQRKLAAIMFTDMVGYTALTQSNEPQALELLEKHRQLIRPLFTKHGGREVKTMGDAFLVEFESALDATECAVEMQQVLHEHNKSATRKVMVRVGIHVGDVIHRGEDVFGDAVNIASRIEPLAQGGETCISEQVYAQVRNKVPFRFAVLGAQTLKNVSFPVGVYKIEIPWEPARDTSEPRHDKLRLAVLPFANISPDRSDEYFSDGLTEELIATLSQIRGLQVIARTSVMRYKGGNQQISTIGEELKVGSVLEGSVRKAGNKVRVSAQLIDVASQAHLWSSNYDRNLDDIFAIQAEIAKSVADALRVELLASEEERIGTSPTEDMDAYALYLKGRVSFSRATKEDDYEKSVEYYEQSLKRDPKFAPAYAGLSSCYSVIWFLGYPSFDEALSKAKEYAQKALELDEQLVEAHVSFARVLGNKWDWSAAERESKRALELNPNSASARMSYARVLFFTERHDQATEQYRKALELDPLSPSTNMYLGTAYLYTDRYDEAIPPLMNALKIDPNNAMAHGNLGLCYIKKEIMAEGLEELKKADALSEGKDAVARADLAYGYAKAGKMGEARRILDGMKAMEKKGGGSLTALAGLYAIVEDSEKAFELLERAHEERLGVLPSIAHEVWFEGIREDPRFVKLLRKMNLR